MWAAVGVYGLNIASGVVPQIPRQVRSLVPILTLIALVVFIIGVVVAARRFSEWLKHRCHHCGYRREGLDPQALCPECGLGPPGSLPGAPAQVLKKDGSESDPGRTSPEPAPQGTRDPSGTTPPAP